ncbi:MAG: SDR family NAD(P)-dependent oxidoreductase [Nostoc sp.]|uniref:NAD(P)-dependent oxidoreductase n=1 Tax=Nostoc sp. TaxID=1180 RepID=UPI002FF4FC01
MKIFVVGATGGIGREVVEQPLAAGHKVTSVARTPSDVQHHHEGLQVVQGDVMQLESLTEAIANCDAVLSALGIIGFRNNPKPTTL